MPDNFDFEAIAFTDGSLTAEMVDGDGDPNKVLDKAATSSVHVTWSLVTTDPWILNGTTFHLKAVAELIGAGEVDVLGTKDVPVVAGTLSWDEYIPVDSLSLEDGAYKIVVLLNHTAPYPTGDKKTRLAGFVEIPMVQFYTHET